MRKSSSGSLVWVKFTELMLSALALKVYLSDVELSSIVNRKMFMVVLVSVVAFPRQFLLVELETVFQGLASLCSARNYPSAGLVGLLTTLPFVLGQDFVGFRLRFLDLLGGD